MWRLANGDRRARQARRRQARGAGVVRAGIDHAVRGDGLRRNGRVLASAFTLVELLVVVAVIGILASLLLPVLGQAKQRAHGAVCLNNLKQLTTAWTMYHLDNDDWLVPNNPHGAYDVEGNNLPSWSLGIMAYGDPDGTNEAKILSERTGSLQPYISAIRTFKCPGDRSVTASGLNGGFGDVSLVPRQSQDQSRNRDRIETAD